QDASHKVSAFSTGTATGTLRRHLYTEHLPDWVRVCDESKIKITAAEALPFVNAHRESVQPGRLQDAGKPGIPRKKFTNEAFVDALVEFIVADDQSLNVIESRHLRSIFLMLREELRESDIPGRTTIRHRIKEQLEDHFLELSRVMRVGHAPLP
ncbi:hypothetical protein FA95DRAFT_1504405, partial [Auriscalpium vulgare]